MRVDGVACVLRVARTARVAARALCAAGRATARTTLRPLASAAATLDLSCGTPAWASRIHERTATAASLPVIVTSIAWNSSAGIPRRAADRFPSEDSNLDLAVQSGASCL